MAEISQLGEAAQFTEGAWVSSAAGLLALCKACTSVHPWNPVPSNPSPDLDVAQFVAQKIGATITHADKPNYVDGRDY